MAIRLVRVDEDPILRAKCKPIPEMTERLAGIIEDMFETMYDSEGVGLAGPQIGIRKRLFVVDTTLDPENGPFERYVCINPEILETEGEQVGSEGCLSIPGKHATVRRPMKVRMRAQNEKMEWYELEAEGLLARAILHENDHLDGILYTDRKEGPLLDNEEAEQETEAR